MNWNLFAGVAVFAMLFSHPAESNEKISVLCDTCISGTQFRSVAKTVANGVDSTVHVGNIYTGELRNFSVEFYREPGSPLEWTALELSPTSAKKTEFASIQSHHRSIIGILQADTVPEHIAASAWDMVGSNSLHNELADYYNQNMSLAQALNNIGLAAFEFTGVYNALDHYRIELEFSDGSRWDFMIVGVTTSGAFRLQLVADSGVDADNQSIPINASDISGHYTFENGGESALNSFINSLNNNHIPVYDNRPGLTGQSYAVCDEKGCTIYLK
ncbi:hypothetical protein [Ferrimonas balearica]|uniref:hypothetical protein n=1 Tax=Ferrimonas balearica TaxID=44012 RepID=UPI001C99E8A2|nr:hypothetical protein [Ferrimonas balearica]MBY5922260.1 hypothetical protein [Ferrimonas balearica]MBY5994400.1 hypothetical protein [Ferrimonas balearica]